MSWQIRLSSVSGDIHSIIQIRVIRYTILRNLTSTLLDTLGKADAVKGTIARCREAHRKSRGRLVASKATSWSHCNPRRSYNIVGENDGNASGNWSRWRNCEPRSHTFSSYAINHRVSSALNFDAELNLDGIL